MAKICVDNHRGFRRTDCGFSSGGRVDSLCYLDVFILARGRVSFGY